MKRGATKESLSTIYNNIAWRNHIISELERQRKQSSMSGRSYK